MGYREEIEANELLRFIPFEHVFRNVPHDVFINRLVTERGLFDGGVMVSDGCSRPMVTLIVVIESLSAEVALHDDKLSLTLLAWFLQSCPWINCIVVEPELTGVQKHLNLTPARNVKFIANQDFNYHNSNLGEYLIFCKPGDIHHPSVATSIALAAKHEEIDFLTWCTQFYRVNDNGVLEIRNFVRAPHLETFTTWHVNHIGTSFSVKKEFARAYPGNLIDEISFADGHPFHAWVVSNSSLNYVTHSEYLSLRAELFFPNVPSESAISQFKPTYERALAELQFVFPGMQLQEMHSSIQLTPVSSDPTVSVIIPFRDKANITCKCIHSLLTQTFTGRLEIILINNQSQSSEREIVQSCVRALGNNVVAKLIDYDRPFNHSDQCNLGIEVSAGEVILLLNNDAEFVSQDALSTMSKWAMVPGIGTVGCRIVTEQGVLVCAGVKSRVNIGYEYHSCVEESKDSNFSQVVRETFANTFACAAISRSVTTTVGLLDAVRFPNGYNDVEYCMRLRSRGYRHIYLGHIVARHKPGTSRGKCDEISQKIALRKSYPNLFKDSLMQLECDEHLMRTKKNVNNALSICGVLTTLSSLVSRR